MGLLEKLRSLFGSDDGSRAGESDGGESTYTVEREPSAATEHAVKGTDDGQELLEDDSSISDTPGDTTEEATDDVERTAGGDGPAGTDDAEETTDGAAASASTEPAGETSGAPVEEISGIGPTYGDRLGAAGIETVADLAAADAETVAEAASASESRAADWIERAREY